jgi:2-oxoglutarate dehydrogenase E1 component
MRVANCTTAAQYFHLLRRQAALLVEDPLPLIVLTPKSLLRHPFTASSPSELAEGKWRQVIDDDDARGRAQEIRKLVLCSGKIAVDLLTSSDRPAAEEIAICRVEQLYPLPINDIRRVIEGYPALEEIVWAQEEPENMGAWDFVRPFLEEEARRGGQRHSVVARPRSSSPSEGSAARHAAVQADLLKQALTTSGVKREAVTR